MPNGAVISVEDVYCRLESLGYAIVPEDEYTVEYLISKITNNLSLNTNNATLPEELLQMAIDMICGEFLCTKYALGQLIGYDFGGAVKKIQEGDTTIEYAYGSGSKTPEERFVAYIKELRTPNPEMLSAVRRLRW